MRSNLALSATLALLMLAQVRNAAAQQNLIMVDYSMAFPLGGLEEYIAKNTWRGFAAGYRYMADDNMAVGIDLDWHHFFERKDQASFTLETATFTGTQYRYNNNFAMTAQWDYVFNEVAICDRTWAWVPGPCTSGGSSMWGSTASKRMIGSSWSSRSSV